MNNEQAHDPTVTLRLELGRVTDQRNAYEAALRKEVLAIIRNATHTADIVGCLHVEMDDLKAENALLRKRIDNLVIKNNERHAELELLDAKKRNLQSEVDRLTDAITAGAITPDAREVQS